MTLKECIWFISLHCFIIRDLFFQISTSKIRFREKESKRCGHWCHKFHIAIYSTSTYPMSTRSGCHWKRWSSRSAHWEKDKTHDKYLNVNLSHELWKDIKIQLLQINYDDPPALLYIFRLLWRWQGFNTIVYFTLVLLGKVFFAGENHVCKP